jgi:hypothetical protein
LNTLQNDIYFDFFENKLKTFLCEF